ncbi:MAG: ClpXP protease specificity-enhancing factor [Betaproteobacteria bacterium]|nr:ClpXP protease specificity-enhancing factor [Betaproteobacteria bacterium]
MEETPTKPYLVRALFEWCVDNGYTPHIAVKVDSNTQVPTDHVRNGEITLNVAPTAVHKLQMGNELIEFSARFSGIARQVLVPVANVYAIYARETGQGMTFEVELAKPATTLAAEAGPLAHFPAAPGESADSDPPKPAGPAGRPALRRVK